MIAIVDDDESVRNSLVRLLQAAGWSARGYTSGLDFLENWRIDRPDCVVLDLQMPNLSGADVQRALNRAGARFPVIVVTAHESPDAREECLRAGAAAFLRKPLDESMLLDTLFLALSSRSLN